MLAVDLEMGTTGSLLGLSRLGDANAASARESCIIVSKYPYTAHLPGDPPTSMFHATKLIPRPVRLMSYMKSLCAKPPNIYSGGGQHVSARYVIVLFIKPCNLW